jgi:hypothetical protein
LTLCDYFNRFRRRCGHSEVVDLIHRLEGALLGRLKLLSTWHGRAIQYVNALEAIARGSFEDVRENALTPADFPCAHRKPRLGPHSFVVFSTNTTDAKMREADHTTKERTFRAFAHLE